MGGRLKWSPVCWGGGGEFASQNGWVKKILVGSRLVSIFSNANRNVSIHKPQAMVTRKQITGGLPAIISLVNNILSVY